MRVTGIFRWSVSKVIIEDALCPDKERGSTTMYTLTGKKENEKKVRRTEVSK